MGVITRTSCRSLSLTVHFMVVLCMSPSMAASGPSLSPQLSSNELQDIFNKALASNSTPTFGSLARALNPHWPKEETATNASACFQVSAESPDAAAKCLASAGRCLTMTEVAGLYGLNENSTLNYTDTEVISPALLFSMVSCDESREDDMESSDQSPSSQAAWGYSFLFVTLINLCSLAGALVLPCMKLKVYKTVLMFMVALAVGTLAGSGLLFLIPEAFLLVHDGNTDYIWKATTIISGVYLFYLLEKLLREINAKRENTKQKKRQDELATEGQFATSFQRQTIHRAIPEKNPDTIPDNITNGGICASSHRRDIPYKTVGESNSFTRITDLGVSSVDNGTDEDIAGQMSTSSAPDDKIYRNGGTVNGSVENNLHSHLHHSSSPQEVAPVAYMIIFGDALHNFIDGLSIGSAFTQSIMTGVSVSVAVMCEELPHELGDFAILLNSGMRIRKAILYNFLSACTCYLGTFIGITLGENTQSHEWIFAIAGGMFLYISLVDMLPEMNASSESPEGKKLGTLKVFLIHNLGLLTGYGIMLIMALYSGNISFE